MQIYPKKTTMNENNKDSVLVDVSEASKILFGSRNEKFQKRLRRMANSDKIRHIKFGNRFFFNREFLSKLAQD